MTTPTTPDTRTAVVGIPDPADGESIARTAAQASLSLLAQVAAEDRGNVSIHSVTITTPEPIPSMAGAEAVLRALRSREGVGESKAVVVTVQVHAPKPAEDGKS